MQQSTHRQAQLTGMSENGYGTYRARQVVKQRFPTPLFSPVFYHAHRISYVSPLEPLRPSCSCRERLVPVRKGRASMDIDRPRQRA